MTSTELKAELAFYIPETLASGLVAVLYKNAFRSLSSRLGLTKSEDVTCLATAQSVAFPVAFLDGSIDKVKVNGVYLKFAPAEKREELTDAGILRYYTVGRTVYFTAPVGYTTVTLTHKVAFTIPADGDTITLSDPMVKVLTLMYMREYYIYVRGLVAMKKENAPDVKSNDIEKLLQNFNADIDRECSFFIV